MKSLIVILCACICTFASAQQRFIKSVEDPAYGTSLRILPASDQGWVLFSKDSLRLTKYNSCGISLWSKRYVLPNVANLPGLCDIVATSDGGFAMLTRDISGLSYAFRLTLLDTSGTVTWSKVYKDMLYDFFPYTVSIDSQGNFIVFSNASHISSPATFNCISKISPAGNLVWAKYYDHGGIWGGAIVTSDDGVLARTGDIFIKTDNAGTVQWTSQFSSTSTYNYFAPLELSDGYVFTNYNSSGPQYISITKMASNGGAVSHVQTSFEGLPPFLYKKSNGNFTGVFNTWDTGMLYSSVVEFDSDLNVVTHGAINFGGIDMSLAGKDMCFTTNATPVVAGTVQGWTNQPFIAKTDNAYHTSCDTTVTINNTAGIAVQVFISTNEISAGLSVEPGSYTVETFNVSSNFYCSSSEPLSLSIGNDTAVCANTSLTLQNTTSAIFDTYSWSTGATTAAITVNQPGVYWLTATYNCGLNTIRDTIVISVIPVVEAHLGENVINCEDSVAILAAPQCSGCNYLWSNGSTSDSISVNEAGLYWLTIENNNGCISSDSVNLSFTKCECNFYVPNAFSPNGNGMNDQFQPVHYCDITDYNLEVFNRWGELIFATTDATTGWNGTYKGRRVEQGVYVYQVSYVPKVNGQLRNYTRRAGTVAVIY